MPYLISLHVQGKNCVFVGGGQVTARKIDSLLDQGALVTVISPQIDPSISLEHVNHIADHYQLHYLTELKPLLVFAATDDPDVNQQVARDAQARGALVNVVDGSAPGDFDNMLTLDRPPIQIAVSTGLPVLSQMIRDEIDALLGDAYPRLAQWLGDLRPLVKSSLPTPAERRAFWQSVITSDVADLLRQNREDEARQQIEAAVQQHLGSVEW